MKKCGDLSLEMLERTETYDMINRLEQEIGNKPYQTCLLYTSLKLLIIAGISLLLEITQYILAIGSSDITDLITNTAGGLLGCLLYTSY